MKNIITEFKLQPLDNPKFIETYLATYRQNGLKRDWDIVKSYDSVAILIYNKDIESFILVKQFRAAVYANNRDGMTIELCAGIIDKDLTLEQIAQEEIAEECGYQVPLESIERVTEFYTSVGFAGCKQTLYYAEVNNSMKISDGGGIDGEVIEVIELSSLEAKRFIYNESMAKTPGLMFAFMWFFDR